MVHFRYRQFQEDCPAGLLTRERFLEMSGEDLGENAEELADTIFKVRKGFLKHMAQSF